MVLASSEDGGHRVPGRVDLPGVKAASVGATGADGNLHYATQMTEGRFGGKPSNVSARGDLEHSGVVDIAPEHRQGSGLCSRDQSVASSLLRDAMRFWLGL